MAARPRLAPWAARPSREATQGPGRWRRTDKLRGVDQDGEKAARGATARVATAKGATATAKTRRERRWARGRVAIQTEAGAERRNGGGEIGATVEKWDRQRNGKERKRRNVVAFRVWSKEERGMKEKDDGKLVG